MGKSKTTLQICRKYIKYLEGDTLKPDVSGIFSRDCFEEWVETRRSKPKQPEESFRRAVTAHIRGTDCRQPFKQEEEEAILAWVRRKGAFDKAFHKNDKRIGNVGFRGLGYHEKLKQSASTSSSTSELESGQTAAKASNLKEIECKKSTGSQEQNNVYIDSESAYSNETPQGNAILDEFPDFIRDIEYDSPGSSCSLDRVDSNEDEEEVPAGNASTITAQAVNENEYENETTDQENNLTHETTTCLTLNPNDATFGYNYKDDEYAAGEMLFEDIQDEIIQIPSLHLYHDNVSNGDNSISMNGNVYTNIILRNEDTELIHGSESGYNDMACQNGIHNNLKGIKVGKRKVVGSHHHNQTMSACMDNSKRNAAFCERVADYQNGKKKRVNLVEEELKQLLEFAFDSGNEPQHEIAKSLVSFLQKEDNIRSAIVQVHKSKGISFFCPRLVERITYARRINDVRFSEDFLVPKNAAFLSDRVIGSDVMDIRSKMIVDSDNISRMLMRGDHRHKAGKLSRQVSHVYGTHMINTITPLVFGGKAIWYHQHIYRYDGTPMWQLVRIEARPDGTLRASWQDVTDTPFMQYISSLPNMDTVSIGYR